MTVVRSAATILSWRTPELRFHDRGAELRTALLLLCIALLLARYGPAMPGIWIPAQLLGVPYVPLAALSFVSGVGAAAYALAHASESPTTGTVAALPAMLAPLVLLPGMSATGLTAPLVVLLVSRDPLHRQVRGLQ